MIKKLFLALGLFLSLGTFTHAAQIFIDPQFSDSRFEPADKLHAGCLHTANVSIKTTANETISSFRFIISYEPEALEILDIKPTDNYKNVLDSKIEYDKIIVSLLNTPISQSSTTKLFTISFKSNENTSGSHLILRKPSYVITKNDKTIPVFVDQKISFAKVAECEPDIIPPTIMLTKPQNVKDALGVDGYFVFNIKDIGKGIDPQSLKIKFDGVTYTGSSSAFVWNKEYISFYPKKWLPVDSKLDLDISINDKQSYGGANTSKKSFTFNTTSGIVFENAITPTIFRNLAGKSKSIYATNEECAALMFLATTTSSPNIPFEQLYSINEKINCPFDKTAITQKIQSDKTKVKSTVFFSVFSVLGWVLFAITFILKLHYLVSYKKHKKIAKSLQSSQSMH